MYCPECGHQNPDTAKFCISCGYRYDPASSVAIPAPSSIKTQPSRPTIVVQKKGRVVPLLILLLLVAGAGVVVFIYATGNEVVRQKDWLGREKPVVDVNASNKGLSGKINLPEVKQRHQSSPPQDANPPAEEASAQSSSGSIVSDSFAVPAGTMKSWRLTEPTGMSGRVVGHFQAQGGSGNDIQAAITDQNAARGGSGRSWYDSGKVTSDSIDVQLGPGTYYLIFSNRFSAFSSKSVTADINMKLQ
jgi:hypothetical protein